MEEMVMMMTVMVMVMMMVMMVMMMMMMMMMMFMPSLPLHAFSQSSCTFDVSGLQSCHVLL
jgi:hypothetical protein